MHNAFVSILVASVFGTLLAGTLFLLRPLSKKVFSVHWHYFMWLAVLAVMVLPVRITLPKEASIIPSITVSQTAEVITQTQQVGDFAPFTSEKTTLFPWIWLAVAVISFSIKLISYFLFLSKLRRTSAPTLCPQISSYTGRTVRVRKSNSLSSPLMIGIFKPTLLLPDRDMTAEQLHNVLSHEMTHFKRGDVLFKWFVCMVKCLHWFNPAVYFIGRQINIYCEISCDVKATENMNREEKLGYVNTILTLLSVGYAKNNSLTTGMTATKSSLKRRFEMIKNHTKSTKTKIILSVILASVLITTTLFASGVLAGSVTDEPDASQTFVWPCPDSNTVSRIFDEENHPAIDIPATGGSDVLAVYGGEVTSADYDAERGYFIITDNGTATVLYAHLSSIEVSEGDTVSSGDVIGKVGKTGMATGDHLHLELTEYGQATDPLDYALDINITQPQKRPF